MAQVEATTERIIAADAETVFDALADYTGIRGKLLPEHFSEYEVREGGDGEGTLVHWKLQATSKRVRDCLLEVTEPTDGQLVEKDRNSSMVTTWTGHPGRRGQVQGRRHHRVGRRRRHRRLLRAHLRAQGPRPHLRHPAREPGRRSRGLSPGVAARSVGGSPDRVDFRPARVEPPEAGRGPAAGGGRAARVGPAACHRRVTDRPGAR